MYLVLILLSYPVLTYFSNYERVVATINAHQCTTRKCIIDNGIGDIAPGWFRIDNNSVLHRNFSDTKCIDVVKIFHNQADV